MWGDISNVAIGALVDPCWWRLSLREAQLCEPTSNTNTTINTTTLRVKYLKDISEYKYMMRSLWTYHEAMQHYVKLWSISTLLTMACKKMKEIKITCIVHMCLHYKIPPMHERWDRVVQVEGLWSMCDMDLHCIKMSDEKPWVIEKFLDWKWD